jgi:hypothetical protein
MIGSKGTEGSGNKFTTPESMIEHLVETSKSYLGDSAKTRDGAGILLARLVIRTDMMSLGLLTSFASWATTCMEEAKANPFTVVGVLTTLSVVFKHGQRHELLPIIGLFLPAALDCASNASNAFTRKLGVKLVQRVGLTFLEPKVAAWRYQRGNRSLLHHLEGSEVGNKCEMTAAEDEDEDIPEALEDVIEFLLCGLRDRDTIVRWSAAKGMGRICNRLPQALADDVVEAVFELLTGQEAEHAWHGGCLAMAELARRGLLLPERLFMAIPVVTRYDLLINSQRGTTASPHLPSPPPPPPHPPPPPPRRLGSQGPGVRRA